LGAKQKGEGRTVAADIVIIIKMGKDAPYLRYELRGFDGGSEASQ
jgi:hypothetical protein